MKKLVYILSLAIGLLMTGCAQWETLESLPRDTWGPEPELTIEVSPLDSITGALISDKMDVVFYIKNATNLHFVYDEGPEQSIDYTALLKGQYGGWSAEPALEGDTLGIQLPVEAGKTYTVYAVVANAAGVQTTAVKTVGAVDVTAPVITTVSPLAATNKGKQVTLAFDENIIRTDAMPAITYEVLDENLESYATGDATAMASGKNLVVTLPATFEFNAEGISIVLLSFGEGSVEDKFGNKMAAIANALDEDGLPNGPWWMYDPTAQAGPTEGFLVDGAEYAYYGISKSFSDDESEVEVGSVGMALTFVQEDVDLTEYFGSKLLADKWSFPSCLSILQGAEAADVPFYSYEAPAQDGNTYTWATFFDPQGPNGLVFAGKYDLSAAGIGVQDCYLVSYDEQSGNLYTTWDFVLTEVSGYEVLRNAGYKAAVIFIADLGQGENPYILFDFEDIMIVDGSVMAGSANVYETPVMIENATIVQKSFSNEVRFLNK